MAPKSTIIITGGTGSLGSTLARTIETSYPGNFHLLLTCRNTSDQHAASITSFLQSKKGHFSLEKLDLADLEDVKAFTNRLKEKVGSGEIPPLVGGGIVNSAACNTFFKGVKAKNGVDIVYTVNCLAPALLVRGLLAELLGREGGKEGALVVNVGSGAYEIGRVGYFETEEVEEGKRGQKVGFVEGMKRYGSSKLLLLMAGYALQRNLYVAYPENKVHIVNLDPGSMNAGGRLMGTERHWIFPVLYGILGAFGPVLRLVRKDAINPPAVPAKAIADLYGNPKDSEKGVWKTGKSFVLDDEKKSNALSLDEGKQDEVWKSIIKDLGLVENLKVYGLD